MAGKVIGRVEIRVSARVDNSRPNMQRDMDRDLDQMQRRAERRRPIKIPVDIDDRELRRKLDRLSREDDRDRKLFRVVADFDYGQVKRGTEVIRKDMKSVERNTVKVDLNKTDFDRRLRQLNRNLQIDPRVVVDEASLNRASNRITRFRHDAQKEIEMPIALGSTALAAARLRWLTRPRVVPILVRVNAKSAAVAIGILRSLAGINTLQKFGERLEDIVTDFDRFAYGIIKVTTLIGSLTNVLGYMSTSLISIGGGISQIAGLVAVLPTLAASSAAVFGVLRIGFNNFIQSFSEIPEVAEAALAKLPPNARKARDALINVFRDFQDPIQELFWENMGNSMETFATVIVPRVQRGMLQITPAVAKMTKAMLDSFEEISNNGTLDTMFDNLNIGLQEATKGVKPFFDAINTLGFRGSFFLGRIGKALGDAAIRFDEFIQHAEKMGRIEAWINNGWKAMKDLWGVTMAVGDQFQALTQIIDAAGGQSLTGFRKNMEDWARFLEQEPFRSRMVRIFRGARDGASELNVGVKTLANTFGEASTVVEALLVSLGKIGSGALERISDILGRPMLQTGLLNGLLETELALKRIRPSAQAIGDTLGAMFDIAGNVLLGVVPMLNQVTDLLRTIVLDLGPGVKDLIPTLVDFLQNFIQVFGGALELATTILSGALSVINAMPGPLQDLTLAFATFLALRGNIGGFLTAMTTFWNQQRVGFTGGIAVVETNAQKFERGFDRMGRAAERGTSRIGNAIRTGGLGLLYGVGTRFETEMAKSSASAERHVGRIERAFGRVKGFVGGFNKAISGIIGFGGGLGGMLLFTGIIAGISALGKAARKEKEAVADFQATLDEFGQATSDTRKAVAEWMNDTKTMDFSSLAEGFDKIGIAASDVVEALAGDSAQFDQFFNGLVEGQQKARQALVEYEQAQREAGNNTQLTEEWDQLNKNARAYDQLVREVEGYARVAEKAKTRQEQISKAMGITNQEAKDLDDAMRNLGSEYSTAATQADALKRAMDILNGTMTESDDATIAAADAVRNLREAIKNATTGDDKISLADMIDMDTGKIDVSFRGDPTGTFAKIQASMRETVETGIADGIDRGTRAPEAGKLSALKAGFEEGLRNLKAEILPQLGKGGEKKLDAWLKANGYEWDTIEAIVTGKITKDELSRIPREMREQISALIGSDPWVEIPVDGDYLPLQGKMTTVEGILEKLGATEVTPTIGADGKKLDESTTSAINALREIDGMSAEAILDADDLGISEKQQEALRKLMEIDSWEAIPRFDANGEPLSLEHQLAMAKILGLDGKEATAKLKAENEQLVEIVRRSDELLDTPQQGKPPELRADGRPTVETVTWVQGEIDSIKQERKPVIDANGEPSLTATRTVQSGIDSIKQKTKPAIDANPEPAKGKARQATAAMTGVPDVIRDITARVVGLGNVQTLLWTIGALKNRTITVTTNYAQRGAGPTRNTALEHGGIMGVPSHLGPVRGAHKYYANGGLSKPSFAHIAPAGSYVTYAEQSTGGEAFIPLAASKRGRSTAILKDVARRFGLNMEDGGVVGAGAGGGDTFNITNHYPQAESNSSALNKAAQIKTVRDRV